MNLGCLLLALSVAQADSSQQLVYDLSIRGKLVGRRDLKITYIPASTSKPLGLRRIEAYTEIDHVIAGKEIKYRQRATAQISGQSAKKFVSSVSINDQVTEIQGRKLRDGSWMVYVVVPGKAMEKHYSRSEIHAFSLELFDPGQLMQWQEKRSFRILSVDGNVPEIWRGVWKDEGTSGISNTHKKIHGRQLSMKAEKGKLNALWAYNGILLDWSVDINGLKIDADIREIPKNPKFGEIKKIKSFKGVDEEEL